MLLQCPNVTAIQPVLRVNWLRAYVLLACWPKSVAEITYFPWDLQITCLLGAKDQAFPEDKAWLHSKIAVTESSKSVEGHVYRWVTAWTPASPACSPSPIPGLPFTALRLHLDGEDDLWDISLPSSQVASFFSHCHLSLSTNFREASIWTQVWNWFSVQWCY